MLARFSRLVADLSGNPNPPDTFSSLLRLCLCPGRCNLWPPMEGLCDRLLLCSVCGAELLLVASCHIVSGYFLGQINIFHSTPYLRILVHPRRHFTARRMRRCPWARIGGTARSTASQHSIVHGVVPVPRTARPISWQRVLQRARFRILPAVSMSARRIIRYLFAEETLQLLCKFPAHAPSGSLRRYCGCAGY
jgi:hypothetical protein